MHQRAPCVYNTEKRCIEFELPPLAAPAPVTDAASGQDGDEGEGKETEAAAAVELEKDVTVTVCLENGHYLEAVAPSVLSYYGTFVYSGVLLADVEGRCRDDHLDNQCLADRSW